MTKAALYAILAPVISLSGLPASAQPAGTGDSKITATGDVNPSIQQDTSGDIVVTARRRSESLQNVPIAVTAISGANLDMKGTLNISELSQSVPNVTLSPSRGSNSTLSAFIRGVGQQDPAPGFEGGVGLYVDDVYLNRPQGSLLDVYDVERIEVLRGPQGTLYGRNTIGGAIKYVTRRLADEPSLSVRATAGTYDQADLVISGSTPVGGDALKVGGAFARLSRGGFGANLTTGQDNLNKDIWAGRLSAEYKPGDWGFFRLSGDYTKDNSNAPGGHRLLPGLVSGSPVLPNVFDSLAGIAGKNSVEAWGVALNSEIHPSERLTLRSITAYRRDESHVFQDFDATPLADVDVPGVFTNKQFSEEAQLLYEGDKLKGLAGVYYLNARSIQYFDVRLFTTVPGLAGYTFGNIGTSTYAGFADFTYDITDRLSLSAGGRYTSDERNAIILRQNLLGGGSPAFGGAGTVLSTISNFQGSKTFHQFTPRASASFKPNSDHNIYVSYAKGFKGGGFDPRGVSTAAPDLNGNGHVDQDDILKFMSFNPEKVESYEIGWKAAMFDRRLRFAAAAFHSNYTDKQVPGSVGAIVNGIPTVVGTTTNAGRASIDGAEFEGTLVAWEGSRPHNALSLGWSAGYIDAKYKQFIDARGIDVANSRVFQNTPKWTASGNIEYKTPFSGGTLDMLASAAYRSKTYMYELPSPGLDQPGYTLFDASVVWKSDSGMWSIGLHGKNLADKHYITSGFNYLKQDQDTGAYIRSANGNVIPTIGKDGTLTAYYGSPRQVFLTVELKL